MKKFLLSLILALVALPIMAANGTPTWDGSQGPFLGKTGGVVADDGSILIGGGSSALTHGGTSGFWANNAYNGTLPVGAPVVFVATGVSLTATPGDPNFIGICLQATANGQLAPIMTQGNIRCIIANTVAIGGKVVCSGTAGWLTPVAAVTETLFTGLSNTAIVGRALQAVTYSGTTKTALIHIGQ